jgi:hypothetical protein
MEGKTYLELLAENDFLAREDYNENAKDLLVSHNEYEETVAPEDNHPHEIEDQDAFKKFAGSHQAAALPAPPEKYSHQNKNSIHHDKHVKTHVINVDSRFRQGTDRSSTDFTFLLQRPLKNLMSIRISSIELPNTYYTFSQVRGNVSFTVKIYGAQQSQSITRTITIPDGNYTNDEMVQVLNAIFVVKVPTSGITAAFITTSGLLYFYSSIVNFDIDFETGDYNQFTGRIYDTCLGYALGFRKKNRINKNVTPPTNTTQYTYQGTNNIKNSIVSTAITCYIGTSIMDTVDSNYLMLSLNPDWKVVCNYTPDKTQHYSFMKIIMTAPKNSVLFDNGANTLTKEYAFNQPTNLTSFPVRLSDPYDQTIDLNGMEFSFTLEIKEVLNSDLYETLRSS